MTNINCLENCIYQKDGKCCLNKTLEHKINSNSNCAYFSKNKK